MARQEKVLTHEPLALFSHRRPDLRPAQQVAGPERRALDGPDPEPRVLVHHLEHDPARLPADHRLLLPERFGHGETESFPERFLKNEIGAALQSVDLSMSVRRED